MPSTSFTEMIASRYSVVQSASVAGLAAGIGLAHLIVAADFAAGLDQRRQDWHEMRAGDGAVDQQGLGRAADAGAPHLGVDGHVTAMSSSAELSM